MQIGEIVRSLQGRDKGRIYVVVGTTIERVLVSDGGVHGVKRPKQKNPKHLTVLGTSPDETITRLREGHHPGNDEIRQLIAAYLQMEGGDVDAER